MNIVFLSVAEQGITGLFSRLLPEPRDGEVVDVDASRIVLRHETSESDNDKQVSIYNLHKFVRSNQNTCFNQRPIVRKGDMVVKGQIIADGPATELGELALGRNIAIAELVGQRDGGQLRLVAVERHRAAPEGRHGEETHRDEGHGGGDDGAPAISRGHAAPPARAAPRGG